jgi:hypothetical protein
MMLKCGQSEYEMTGQWAEGEMSFVFDIEVN